MNFAIIGVVIALLAAGLGITGKLLLKSYEHVGELKADLSAANAVLKQKERDADLSGQLVALQTALTQSINGITIPFRASINNAIINPMCDGNPAFVAANDGVQQLRKGAGPRR